MIYRLIYAAIAIIATAGIARAQAIEALAEVNAARAAKGLRPFVHDPNLTAGAMQAATLRAERGIHGHLANDFACLPPGTTAAAAGCGVEHLGFGFLACCVYDNFQTAGAAKCRDANGRWYFHLFVNGSQSHGGYNDRVYSQPSSTRRRR